VALGPDFEGAVTTTFDTFELSVITHELLAIGLSESSIRKVMGNNIIELLLRRPPNE